MKKLKVMGRNTLRLVHFGQEKEYVEYINLEKFGDIWKIKAFVA